MDVSWCLPWFKSKSNQWYLEMMTRLIMWKIHETSKELVAFSLVRTFIEESQSQVEVLQGKKRWPKHDYCNNKIETAFTFFMIMSSWYWIKFVLFEKSNFESQKERKVHTFIFIFTWTFAPKNVKSGSFQFWLRITCRILSFCTVLVLFSI